MTSLRVRLFLLLTTATSVIWLSAAGWIYISTHRQVGRALDARLVEAGRMVASLVGGQEADPGIAARLPIPYEAGYGRQLSCQIWSLDGRLLGRSSGAPDAELAQHADGISETVIDGERWRVFAVEDPTQRVRILVGDNLKVRDRLVGDVILGLLLPAALVLPALAGLIWFGVGSGLAPLHRLASALRRRDADDLEPLDAAPATAEIVPVVEALNGLFARARAARERERQFIAFAAHELRTPLAGLRTQAQVAIAAQDEAMRMTALRQILVAVDRTSRLVRQLLDLSRLDADGAAPPTAWVDLDGVFSALRQELSLLCRARDVVLVLEEGVDGAELCVNEGLLFMALRNLAENAVRHTPSGGRAAWSLRRTGPAVALAVEDEGPGIPPDELEMVFRRFFRGRHRGGIGAGLGLSIAELALRRTGAELRLCNRQGGGLRAEIVIAAERVRSRSAPAGGSVFRAAPSRPAVERRAGHAAGEGKATTTD